MGVDDTHDDDDNGVDFVPAVVGAYGKECDSKQIAAVYTYKAKMAAGVTLKTSRIGKVQIRLYNLLFLVAELVVMGWVVSTVGQPYHQFLEKADREGFQVMEGSYQMRAELEHSVLREINDPDRRIKKIGWFDWMDMDIEELAEEKKRDKERSVLDSLPKHMRVPSKTAVSFWSALTMGVLLTLHALVLLMQIWSVSFNVWINYREVDGADVAIPESMIELSNDDDDDEDEHDHKVATTVAANDNATSNSFVHTNIPHDLPTHVRIVPNKRAARHVLLPIEYFPVLGMTFEYHRRRYYYVPDEERWAKIRCVTNFPLRILDKWAGFGSRDKLTRGQLRYGPNMFQVKQPTFIELYKKQLVNPFSVFQVFCVLLWAIDDYITYSIFQLFMVFTFEGTVVFQRIKSLQAVKGMGNPSRSIHVYRVQQWVAVDTTELLPGDICSLVRHKPHHMRQKKPQLENGDNKKPASTKTMSSRIEDEGGDIVPADLLLLRGSTVVNEASLTGESVPQMKEGLTELGSDSDDDGEASRLEMKTHHKMNVVYAGTKMLQCKGASEFMAEHKKEDEDEATTSQKQQQQSPSSQLYSQIPNPPDDGCICFVLRTGFASAQGKLVRMIEGSQEKVAGHERETGLLLLLLCVFAIISSSYVLYHGMHDEKRSKYELLLHCIMIVTSVIRPELPMQMALAVNNSLMTLLKMHVFCTEPYRVPTAGKLDACLFDKTGTLTTDELVAAGVCTPDKLAVTASKKQADKQQGDDGASNDDDDAAELLTPMISIPSSSVGGGGGSVSGDAALVLAGCHSLVVIDEETTGDPLESAALTSMRWQLDETTGHAIPQPSRTTDKGRAIAGGKPIVMSSSAYGTSPIQQVEILARHHFSSKLQRMSCVVATGTGRKFVVAKGSPEMIGTLLASKPAGYDAMAARLSKQGYRVIALSLRQISNQREIDQAVETRSVCETNLVFVGFIAFTCMVRKDTAVVLRQLRQGGMSIAMVTGDALLTAIHVAKEVDICVATSGEDGSDENDILAKEKNEELRAFLERKRQQKLQQHGGTTSAAMTTNNSKKRKKKSTPSKTYRPILYLGTDDKDDQDRLFWCSYHDGSEVEPYEANRVPELAQHYDLATTGKCLALAYEIDVDTKLVLEHIKIFARMTPDAKETVIEHLHGCNKLCLMCGDGANDVGALKQADVGVALLSGFGNVNVDKQQQKDEKEEENNKKGAGGTSQPTAIVSREHIEQVRSWPVPMIKMQIRNVCKVEPNDYPDLVEKEDLIQLYQIKAREIAVKRHDAKQKQAQTKMTKAEKQQEARDKMMEKQRRMQERAAELEAQGEQWATFKAMREMWSNEMEEAKKKKTEMSRQRGVEGSAATLAAQLEEQLGGGGEGAAAAPGELPMVKLGDASIAAPFTSKMPSIKSCVDIVRQGRCTLVSSIQMYQIMSLQCLISSYSLSVLYLDGVKYGDTQMTGMGLLGTVSFMSVSRSKPLSKLSKVRPLNSIFHPALFISLLGQFAIHLTTMVVAVRTAKRHMPPDFEVDLDGEFKPGILNTVVFLVSGVQQVTVFFVNLQGRPFMTGITENRPLLWSLAATFILTFMFASETVPGLNRYFQLVSFPSDDFRDFLLTLLVGNLIATFTLDRIAQFCFCRDILYASIEGTTWTDVMKLGRTFLVIGTIMYTFLGNSETWDMMLEMEQNMMSDENQTTMNNATNATAAAAAECVGAACRAINETVGEAIRGSEEL